MKEGAQVRKVARRLAHVAENIGAIEDKRRRLIDQYASEKITGEEYITANRALDGELERLTREKAELVAALKSPQQEDFVDASIRQFCATANARLHSCTDFDSKREFLVGYVGGVIYKGYKITITGHVPIKWASGETTLKFRIHDEIDIMAVRRSSQRIGREKQKLAALRPIAGPVPSPVAAE
jgi:hypothetical protein